VDLYSASSWTHLLVAQVWHGFSRDITVLPAHPAFPPLFVNGMNHTCLYFLSRSWSSFSDPEGMEGWVGLGGTGWLHIEINVWHQEIWFDNLIWIKQWPFEAWTVSDQELMIAYITYTHINRRAAGKPLMRRMCTGIRRFLGLRKSTGQAKKCDTSRTM